MALTLRVPKGRRHRYRFIVNGRGQLIHDPETQPRAAQKSKTWSSFWTWTYNEPINLERWEMALIGRMTNALLPVQGRETRNLIERGLNDGNVMHFFRMDIYGRRRETTLTTSWHVKSGTILGLYGFVCR